MTVSDPQPAPRPDPLAATAAAIRSIDSLPVPDQVAVFEKIHAELAAALDATIVDAAGAQ